MSIIPNNTINANITQYHFTIHDVSGKLILNGTTKQSIEIKDIIDGMYFITIKDESGNLLKVTKFIKSTY